MIDLVALVLQVTPEKALMKLVGLGACIAGIAIMCGRRGFWVGAVLVVVGLLAVLS